MNDLFPYPEKECCEAQIGSAKGPSILDTFKRRQLRLKEDLANVNAAIKWLEEHPEINTGFELIAKAR